MGHADRSAYVERPFHHVENNFYPGRFNRHFRAVPFELLAAERPALKPLPLHLPEVYDLHDRRVDPEGYVTLHTNRYRVPEALIGRQVQLHEKADRIVVFDGHRLVVDHPKADDGLGVRIPPPERERRPRRREPPTPEESALRAASPALGAVVDALRARHGGH